jgi:hypothetical protein
MPSRSGFPIAGLALALLAFAVWAFFSIWPGYMRTGAFRIREAWDTGIFWYIGAPLMLCAQALAGALARGELWKQPLWTVGGLFAGLLLVRRSGTDFGLLPLALIFVGAPSYAALLGAAAIGRALGR